MGSVVEVTGLEPTTSWSLTKRATKLRYTSICRFLWRSATAPCGSISNYREFSESVK